MAIAKDSSPKISLSTLTAIMDTPWPPHHTAFRQHESGEPRETSTRFTYREYPSSLGDTSDTPTSPSSSKRTWKLFPNLSIVKKWSFWTFASQKTAAVDTTGRMPTVLPPVPENQYSQDGKDQNDQITQVIEVPSSSRKIGHNMFTEPSTSLANPDGTPKPTCSLNLICYRPGSQGCVIRQIQVVKRSLCTDGKVFGALLSTNPDLIQTDEEFFQSLQTEYSKKMCSLTRRLFSLKTLRKIRLLSVSILLVFFVECRYLMWIQYEPETRPKIVPIDDFTLQEIFFAYSKPSTIKSTFEWVDWVFELRQPNQRHALEFVEGWSGFRVAIVGSMPMFISTVVGITWAAKGDVTTAFTVAAFILTLGTSKYLYCVRLE
jgi:hypothetical protein